MTRPLIPALLAVLFAAGCTGKDTSVQPTATQAEAVQRVEQLVQESAGHLPTGATLKFSDGHDDMPCDDPSDNGPAGRIFVEHRYTIQVPAGTTLKADDVIPPLVAFWQQRGYRVRTDLRTQADPKYAVETSDGYTVVVDGYDRGSYADFTLTGSSACIWPNGTPSAG